MLSELLRRWNALGGVVGPDDLAGSDGRADLQRTCGSGMEDTMTVKPIPEGHRTVTPYLVVPGVARLIEFLKRAFGAEEVLCRRARTAA